MRALPRSGPTQRRGPMRRIGASMSNTALCRRKDDDLEIVLDPRHDVTFAGFGLRIFTSGQA